MTHLSQQVTPLTMDSVLGFWKTVQVDSEKTCLIALNNGGASGRYGAQLERCQIQEFSSVRSWVLNGDTFDLVAADGRRVARFRPTALDSFADVSGTFRLERAAVQ